MKRLAWAALLLMLYWKTPARAQEQGGESKETSEEGGNMAIWQWANFALLAGGLGYVIKKNAGPYYLKRSQAIRKGMIEAEAARAESDAKIAEVDRRLANLQAEIAAMRRNAQEEAEAEAQRARKEAEAEMAKIQAHLAEEIASAAKGARLELRRYSAELALGLAEQKIAARLSPQIQNRLVAGFMTGLEHAAPSGRAD
ncbi:MAG TPA: ATP synthase F0 subunit B [Bryobacteraceae bacterium]|nr:ATP synthase F0 subunit B [Bryobacteraceae bacterium]